MGNGGRHVPKGEGPMGRGQANMPVVARRGGVRAHKGHGTPGRSAKKGGAGKMHDKNGRQKHRGHAEPLREDSEVLLQLRRDL
jgi:hypothetical protein